MTPEHLKKIKRRIVNFIFQFATEAQILEIARLLNINTEVKEEEK